MKGKPTKTEKILLAVAALFLCVLLGFFLRDRQIVRSGQTLLETEYAAASSVVVPPSADLININTAPAEQLAQLPGIGEELAARIVEYRQTHGAFQNPAEIQKVSGIGEAKYEAMREYITVGEDAP